MSGRTLARRLDRIETKLNPTDKPGITVIVVAAGEEKILHVLGRERFRTEGQNGSSGEADSSTHTPDNA